MNHILTTAAGDRDLSLRSERAVLWETYPPAAGEGVELLGVLPSLDSDFFELADVDGLFRLRVAGVLLRWRFSGLPTLGPGKLLR